MTDYPVGDAVVFPQDEGVGDVADGNESWTSAAYLSGLSQMIGTSGYVHSGLTFSGHDAGADTVDVDAGRCYVMLPVSELTNALQSTLGGTAPPSYDTTPTEAVPMLLWLPSGEATLDVQDSTLSAVWVAYATDDSVNGVDVGDVYVRTDHDGGQTAPSHPSVKLGEVNPDDSSADTRANDTPSQGSLSLESLVDSADGQAWETLKAAGYETGDVIPIRFLTPHQPGPDSTTSSSYVVHGKVNKIECSINDFVPADVTVVARIGWFFLSIGSGDTYDMRVEAGGDTLVESTGHTADSDSPQDWQEVTIDRTVTRGWQLEHRISAGTSGSSATFPFCDLGIQL